MPETLPEATPIQKIAAVDKSKPTPPITPARPGSIVLFTDGACSGNPGPAGLGVLMQDGDSKRELSGYLGMATNNIAELDAIRRGLKMIGDKTRPVDLYTDSNYAIGVLTKGWKAKANTELVEEIRDLLEDFRNIRFHWVRGHMGHDGNERADELARMAIEKRETREFES
ncbi:MAG: ribonuclease HI [Myxococcales bacterium]|nr:ribonuclease HI [Myxococcales bacterium]